MLFEIPEGDPQYDEWALECGYFILIFGQIESVTRALERNLLERRPGTGSEDQGRSRPRLDLLIEAVNAKTDFPNRTELAECLREVIALTDTRNLIAHNGLSMEPSSNEPMGRLVVKIRSTRKLLSEKRIDFVKLKEYRIKVTELHRRLVVTALPFMFSSSLDSDEDPDREDELL